MKKSFLLRVLTLSLAGLLFSPSLQCFAMADMEAQKYLPVQSDNIDNWPVAPPISAYSALLMDADTGVVLYEKNAHETMYPASTTKLMTCLLAMESDKSDLNDLVPFSWEAVMTVPRDSSNMGMDANEKMTLEECLYGILVVSANEVSNAVAEYISGDIDSFVYLMNERAKELGCENTHFCNPHGYTDPNHYTSAYDLALIARVFFSNELLAKISRTPSYHWYATEYQPDDFILGSTNYFMRGKKECEGIVGSKTGYTDESRNVLVTCAERNGMRLIAVVMKEETPFQYDDTNTLLDYGFSNFDVINISEHESRYTVTDETFFHSDSSLFGDPSGIFKMDSNATVILPKTTSFENLSSELKLDDAGNSDIVATVTYTYNNVFLGEADIFYANKNLSSFVFDEVSSTIENEKENEPIFIYINYVIYGLIALVIIILLITIIRKILSNYHFAERRKVRRRWRKRRNKVKNRARKKL